VGPGGGGEEPVWKGGGECQVCAEAG
jgi:hypothetical protein